MSSEISVPVINLSEVLRQDSIELDTNSPSLSKVVESVRNACSEWGFFYVTGHGVTEELVNDLKSVAKDFFGRPKEFKQLVKRTTENFRGYSDSELTKRKLDWKEVFDFGKEHTTNDTRPTVDPGKNQWPENMPEFKSTLIKYFSEMHALGFVIMDLIFLGLETNPETMRQCFNINSDSSSARLNWYPACPVDDAENRFGVGPHSDSGVLTILLQDDDVSSLQVQKDGKFYNVSPIKGSYVVNIGDMTQVWSNKLYKAAIHQVLTNKGKNRLSVPFFFNPAYEVDVKPLEHCITKDQPCRYRTINYGAYRSERIVGNFADYGEEIQVYHFEIK